MRSPCQFYNWILIKSANSVIKITWWAHGGISRPLFIIIFRLEMLKFHPYSVLIRDTIVGFVIFYVLRTPVENQMSLPNVSKNCLLIPPDKKSSSVPSSEVSFVSIYGLPIWVVTYDHFLIKDWVRHFLSLKTEK